VTDCSVAVDAAGRGGVAPRVLFLDPRLVTPGYDIALRTALAARGGERILWGSTLAVRGDISFEPDLPLLLRSHWARRQLKLPGRLVNPLARVNYRRDRERILRFCEERRIELVHLNWCSFPRADLELLRALRRRDIRLLLTAHNAKPHEASSLPSAALAAIYCEVDHIVVLSRYVREQIRAAVGLAESRFTLIPHGDYANSFFPLLPSVEAPPPVAGAPRLVCLGQIRRYKGIVDLLAAWPRVLRKHPRAQLTIAGRVSLDARGEIWRALRRWKPPPGSVTLEFGYVPRRRFQEHLQGATALLQPYRWASQSGNTAHAYACGVPVVATRVGGLPEMVREGETGFLAEPEDPPALADAITRVIVANEGRRMAEACLRYHRTRCSWPKIAADLGLLYRRLVAGGL
jgi:phosphatidylinositol alpha-1,6-mannosyltransferase